MLIANSKEATSFRRWATKTLKEYIKKGFVVNTEMLKIVPKFGRDYFNELLLKIKEIRASERRFYQKITDIYTTSIDYDKKIKGIGKWTAEYISMRTMKNTNILLDTDCCRKQWEFDRLCRMDKKKKYLLEHEKADMSNLFVPTKGTAI